MRGQFGEAFGQTQIENQTVQRTERRSCGTGSPHVEDRAALHAEPGAHRALVFGGNKNRHAGKPVRAPLAHRLHRTKHAGKHLPIAADFYARLDNVANAGNAHFIAGRNNFEPSGLNGFLSQDRLFDGARDRSLIDPMHN